MSGLYFEIFYFEPLDPELLSAAGSILRPLNIIDEFNRYRYCTTVVYSGPEQFPGHVPVGLPAYLLS